MTVAQLREQAKSLGLKGYSRWRKAELIERIAKAKPVAKTPTLAELRNEARSRGLKKYSRLNKSQLIDLLANTARLATPKPTLDEQVIAAIAALPAELNDAKCLARYLANRPTPSDVRTLANRELRAIMSLREAATSDAEWKCWTNRYIAISQGVQA